MLTGTRSTWGAFAPPKGDDPRPLCLWGAATSLHLARARRFVTGSGTAAGSPGVRVGARVNLEGLGKPFNGEYRVTRTRHSFDLMNGYRTDFDVERAGMGAP